MQWCLVAASLGMALGWGWLAVARAATTNATAAAPVARAGVAAPATNAPIPVVVVIPKAVFQTNVDNGGIDPFFPKSTRRMPVVQATEPAAGVKGAAKASTLLKLKGIVAGGGKRKLALINNREFAAGESNTVMAEDIPVVVHCIEIREDSVVVRMGSKPELHELRMKSD